MMQSTSEGCLDIAELANQLIREKIFINSERQLLQNLNEQVEKSSLELLQAAWICSQQRQNLNNIITARSEAESVAACQRTSQLEDVAFIDVYKVLKYKEALALGELLGWLRDSPHLVALCLLLGEDHIMPSLIPSLVAGLYGSCRSQANRTRLLAVIRSLIKHQMVPSGDPRKLFRTGRGALATLFSVFRDGHTPARQFLISALQGPIMAVLQEDEFFLDIDPDKSMERFSHSDRLKKFGQPNSPEYVAKVARYRKWAVQSLYNLTCKFIASLREHWPGFPSAFAWILQQMMHLMKQHARTPERELHAICTDLIFNQYICPAIVNPEAHGVVEIPVSYIARFNLIQIAQIIQTLCRAKYQEIDPKVRDLYSKFDRSCVSSLIESVSSDGWSPATAPESPPQTNAALYTSADALALITFLKRISSKLNNNTPSVTSEEMSSGSGPVAEASALSETSSEGSLSWSEGGTSRLAALLQTVEPNYKSRLHDLLKKMPDFSQVRITQAETKDPPNAIENGSIKRGILAKVPKPRLPRSASSGSALALTEDRPTSADREEKREKMHVLVIKLANVEEYDYVGMEPESKVLECYYGGSEVDDPDDGASGVAAAPLPVQKRTRFSVSHDEVSLGNTSDNLEAVSEAASNHSVTSSLDIETEDQNDNLSDMVSANVSGRGSPNISGRETPSSQVTDGDAPPRRPLPNVPANQSAATQANQAKLLKQARSDIDEKFCKFEIKKLLEGDETISIMSDTWSTDVLASDSETIGDSCENTQIPANQGMNASNTTAPDVSETASESAWSMDVLASDSDRNTEVDTDDCVSVAARSDTSWPRRPSNQEESTPVKQSTPNGSIRKAELNSPRHNFRPALPNRSGSGYLTATAALCRGGELDLSADSRKSILVNGYPVMTCFANSAPESPSTSAPANVNNDVFEFVQQNGTSSATESTLEGSRQSDATSQWVDDSFPPRPSTSRHYEEPDLPSSDEGPNDDLLARMNSVTISTRVVQEIRTSVVVSRKNEVSMSTLSVNSVESVSDRSSSQDVNSDIVTERRVSPPPKISTGAIPKSISFDSTAEKSQRRRILGEEGLVGNFDEIKNNMKRSGGNILNKIKMFRQKGRGNQQPEMSREIKLPEAQAPIQCDQYRGEDSSEEILAKYRRGVENKTQRTQRRPQVAANSNEGVMDLNDLEVFNSMKRKLRMVLSNPDLNSMEYVPNRCTASSLVEWVRVCAARGGGAAAGELARALAGSAGAAGGAGGARLAAALRADLAARRPYAAHLAAARAHLTHALHNLHTQLSVVRGECLGCARLAAAARVLQQLERSNALKRLARQQRAADDPASLHGGELMDEKATRLTACIKAITSEVKADPSWEGASATLLETAEITVERAAFARIYLHVLFPNGDGDIARDQVLSEHIRRLSALGGAAALGVAARHAWGAPFQRAQAALQRLPVARAPRDKITCVMNCVRAIMAVLSLSDGAPPSADDLTPVLVYVIIRVNPPSLLSTIELVSALGGASLSGEQLYWWTQFCSAVAYIKTMDYAVADS